MGKKGKRKKGFRVPLGNEDWRKLKNRSGAGPHKRKRGREMEEWEEDWELYDGIYDTKN